MRKVVLGSRVTLPENFAYKLELSFNPLASVTLAVGLPYLLVNRALVLLSVYCSSSRDPPGELAVKHTKKEKQANRDDKLLFKFFHCSSLDHKHVNFNAILQRPVTFSLTQKHKAGDIISMF